MREVIGSFQPDVIMHLAAESHVDRSIDDSGDFVRTNVVGTITLLTEALRYWRGLSGPRKEAFRFHHISTDEVFGTLGAEGTFDEISAYRPNSPYSASKAASDHFVRAWYETYEMPTMLTWCSNNYGPYQFPEKLIPLITINALEGKPLPVYGCGENVRDWIFVDDHADALLLVAERGNPGQTYALGGSCERRNIDVVRAICDLVDEFAPSQLESCRRLIQFVDDRPGHDLRYAVNSAKVERAFGWRPAHSFDRGLAETVRWYLENRTWWERVRSGIYRGERLGRL
jgi:dTDP-glucose 4,6-dehydratase